MTMPPFAAWLIAGPDWRGALLQLAGLLAVLILPAALLIRRAPDGATDADAPAAADVRLEMTIAKALRLPQFSILVLTNFFCCPTHSGPIFHG